MKNVSIFAIMVLVVLLAGCSAPEQILSSDPVCLPGIEVPETMEVARTVLDRMQFTMEKYDTQARYLRTRPLSGAQFFQIWRQDNASAYTSAEANLKSLRRIVEMEFSPFANRTCIKCRVYVQQLSLPEEPIEGVLRMAGNYTDSSSSNQTLRLEGRQLEKMEWLDKGLDRALEQKILEKIKEEVAL